MPIPRQGVAKHIPAEENAPNNWAFIARQRRGKQALSTVQDVFSMGPPRNYISGTEPNQIRTRMKRVLGSEGRWMPLMIDCEL
jgi:hypothetical protein